MKTQPIYTPCSNCGTVDHTDYACPCRCHAVKTAAGRRITKMTVKDLIEKLQEFAPDAEVHIAYSYGDHWRTQVAPAVTAAEETQVEWSEYHRMDRIVDDEDYDDERIRPVVVIR